MIRFAILGPLQVHEELQPLGIGGGRLRKLLGTLLVHRNEPVTIDRLIDELWGEQPPPTAAKALQGHVSQLRRQLGSATVETVPGGYLLHVAPGAVDAERFESLLQEARPLELVAAAAKLREALALWRGPALVDFAYDDFAQSEIERLEQLRQSCLERRIDIELALGHHDDLVPELEALVRAHPLRERLRHHLMLALYRSGRQADALAAYQDARTTLHDELGLEPSEELRALQKAILAQDESLAAPTRVEVPATSATPQPAPAAKGRRPRGAVIAVVVGVALLCAGALVAGIELLSDDTPAPVIVPRNSVARVDVRRHRVESFVGVGRRPVSLAVGATGVWVSNADDGTVDQLDPRTGELVHTIGIGADIYTVAVGFRSVWVAGGNDGTLIRIDEKVGQIQRTLSLGDPQSLAPVSVFFVATDDRYVWATQGDRLLRIDPRTDRVTGRVTVGAATSLTVGAGSVWVTTNADRLLRVDSRSVTTTAAVNLNSIAIDSVYGAGRLWLADAAQSGAVQAVDPVSLAVTTLGTSVAYPETLAVGSGSLWVANGTGLLERIGIRSGRRLDRLQVGPGLSAVASDGGTVWVAVAGTT